MMSEALMVFLTGGVIFFCVGYVFGWARGVEYAAKGLAAEVGALRRLLLRPDGAE